ncbi:MAG: hypothetical protein ABJB61_03230 [bacterium]
MAATDGYQTTMAHYYGIRTLETNCYWQMDADAFEPPQTNDRAEMYQMKHLTSFAVLILLVAGASTVLAQDAHTSDQVDYSIELPSSLWRLISEPDSMHERAEFVYGDRMDGYLQIRKEIVDAGTSPSDVARRDQEQKLRYIPGFVEGKQEPFSGRLSGVTASYEFTKAGKPMMGRIYYLQADNRTIYALRFTGLRDKLARIRNQTDSIARSFKLK